MVVPDGAGGLDLEWTVGGAFRVDATQVGVGGNCRTSLIAQYARRCDTVATSKPVVVLA